MAKVCKIVRSCDRRSSTDSHELSKEIDWKSCILCQGNTYEALVSPANSKRKDIGAGYTSLAHNLTQFIEIDVKPFVFDIKDLDDGSGIENTLTRNKAVWHKSCRNKINNTEFKRAQKRKQEENEADHACASPVKTRRSYASTADFQVEEQCFFCDGSEGKLHKASTFEID